MKRISKKNALLELAKLLTTCHAHNVDSDAYHCFAVRLAYVLWQIYSKDGKVFDVDLLSVEESILSL